MNKYMFLSAAALLTAGVAHSQSFIAGLDFGVNSFASDVQFNTGSGGENSAFTLIIQSGAADDNFSFGAFTQSNWAATGEFYTDGTDSFGAGDFSQIPVTVQNITGGGFAPSTDAFGNTSANAQGFSAAHGISFGPNVNGIFQIAVGTSSLGGGFEDVSINFDVAALGTEGQTAGTLVVNGNNVAVTSSAANQTVSLGDFNPGDFITFDLSGLSGGASFDNFMIAGTAVPEPSAFAALAGALALGFVAIRRRRS